MTSMEIFDCELPGFSNAKLPPLDSHFPHNLYCTWAAHQQPPSFGIHSARLLKLSFWDALYVYGR